MGKTKGLVFTIAGICAFELAAYELNQPGLVELIQDTANSIDQSNIIGPFFHNIFDYFGMYARDFFYDKFAALGTAGQVSMYGGLANIIYNTLKKPGKEAEEKD